MKINKRNILIFFISFIVILIIANLNNIKSFFKNIKEDFDNYIPNNQIEEMVFSSNYFSNYKGVLVVKTPLDASFSYGVIGLSKRQQRVNTLKHEYGHAVQLDNIGIIKYTTSVAIPSVTINILSRIDKLKYDYYGAPFEAEADKLGGVDRNYNNKPWPEGVTYGDILKMFWE